MKSVKFAGFFCVLLIAGALLVPSGTTSAYAVVDDTNTDTVTANCPANSTNCDNNAFDKAHNCTDNGATNTKTTPIDSCSDCDGNGVYHHITGTHVTQTLIYECKATDGSLTEKYFNCYRDTVTYGGACTP